MTAAANYREARLDRQRLKRKSLRPLKTVAVCVPDELRAATINRLESRIEYDPNGGCWLWTGAHVRAGYGSMYFGGRDVRATRLSYALHKAPVAGGDVICHRCDTPACVNPAHLFIGTPLSNARDMVAKGRSTKGERSAHAKLSEDQVREIKRLIAAEVPLSEIGRRFGVGYGNVWCIRRGETWSHVQ